MAVTAGGVGGPGVATTPPRRTTPSICLTRWDQGEATLEAMREAEVEVCVKK